MVAPGLAVVVRKKRIRRRRFDSQTAARAQPPAQSACPLGRRLRIEPLEDRRLLALVTVNTIADTVDFNDGATSLREAIFATNLVGGPDTIQFDFGHDGPATIRLTQGELKITDSLAINGPGAGLLTIDASGNDPTPDINNGDGSRAFNIDDGNSEQQIDITLAGLSITGGDVTGGGGGIRSVERLTIAATTVRDNSSRTVLNENNAPGGGGIYSGGDLTVLLSTIQENSSIGGNFSRGGGIHSARGNLSVTGSTISGNTARVGGGITIYYLGQPPTVVTAAINGSTISGNHADGGGGIASFRAQLTVTESTIKGNSANGVQGQGGGILAGGGGSVLVTDSLISDNSSIFHGGAISSTVGVTLTGSTISGNTAGIFGGAVYVYGGVTVIDSTVTGNSARVGGGLANIAIFGRIDVSGSTISGNSATSSGGGIFSDGGLSKVTVSNSTISRNSTDRSGGGIFSLGRVEVVSSTLSGNAALENGGGVYVGPGGIPVAGDQIIRHSTIAFNSADDTGGGIFVGLGTLTLDHAVVAMNTAQNGQDVARNPTVNVDVRFGLIGHNDQSGLAESPAGLPDDKGNRIGGPTNGAIDPILGPLADNGGPTMTHALLPGSPAINAGDLNAVAGAGDVPQFDQRGAPFGRIFNGRIDIGAFEYQQPSDLNLLVDTLGDDSDGNRGLGNLSLREAIELSNNFASTDTIRFASNLAGGTIRLSRGELVISDSTTIDGANAGKITVDAGGSDPTPDTDDGRGSRVFQIDDRSNDLKKVTIRQLTLTGGDASGPGGAILAREDLTLVDCVITGNATFSRSQLGGGGIYSATGSGAPNSLTLIGCTITKNAAAFDEGGGIRKRYGTLVIEDSTISDNTAFTFGGGLSAADGGVNVQVRSSTFSDNSSEFWYGGGLFIYNGSLSLVDSTVSGNAADYGAGIYLTAFSEGTISGSAIIRNTAYSDGGGIYVLDSRLTVANSTFSGNTAQGFGGGLATYDSTLVVRHSTITANRADDDNFGDERAGGVSLGGSSTLTLDHTILAGNFRALSTRSDALGVIGARYSLIGVSTDATIFDFGGNLTGSAVSPADPRLGPLADNGGPTMTHALLAGSPAIDRGDPVLAAGAGETPAFDQRGAPYTRVANGDTRGGVRIDIGAFELQVVGPTLPGDYNVDGVVDTADYVLWRNTLSNNVAPFSGADGDGDGVIDQDDHVVWRSNFGRRSPSLTGDTSVGTTSNLPTTIAGASFLARDDAGTRQPGGRVFAPRPDENVLRVSQHDESLWAWLTARRDEQLAPFETASWSNILDALRTDALWKRDLDALDDVFQSGLDFD